jgi:murein L,D-transpeptidase YcbB/YkuD
LKTCDVKAPLLKRGNTGNAVKNAQTLLISKGYACGGSFSGGRETPDGDFGPTTEKSVKSFQGLKKLTADGVIGSDTWKALIMVRRRKLERFIETVEVLPELYTEFDAGQWAALVDRMTVHAKDRITFTLTCGMEIEE